MIKRECFFCGAILIDMIDNQIDNASKDFEFAAPLLGDDLNNEYWDIK